MTKFPVKELGASAERPRERDADYSATCLDFHLSMSDSAPRDPPRARSGNWRLLFRNHNQEVEDLAAARRAHGIPDDEFVAATTGEEFSLPCPLDALF